MVEPHHRSPGAYGLTLLGTEAMRHLLVDPPASWPSVSIIQRRSSSPSSEVDGIGDIRSVLVMANGGDLVIERGPMRVTITAPELLGPEALAHPYLSPVATMFARWLGRESFHGGGVVVNGGVWALLGGKEGGKSTLLAWLASRGYPIVTDDVLVVDGTTAFAGPRSIDLRDSAACALGQGEYLGVVGARERWRVPLPPVQPELPLRGWVYLEWDSTIQLTRVPAAGRLQRLAKARGIALAPKDPTALLRLAALPAYELRRTRDFDSLGQIESRLMEVLV